jgi:hypothetical protein
MPSVSRVGSCSITGSPISSVVVGRVNSSRPMVTRWRSSGQDEVGSFVGSSSSASRIGEDPRCRWSASPKASQGTRAVTGTAGT